MALGAGTRDVLWLILSTGSAVIVVGALIGSAGALAVSRVLSSTIPTLPTRDPIALTALILFLVFVALVACFVPAGRAARVDPLSGAAPRVTQAGLKTRLYTIEDRRSDLTRSSTRATRPAPQRRCPALRRRCARWR